MQHRSVRLALRLVVVASIFVSIIGCARTRRTIIEEEVGGIGTGWMATSTQAGIWQDQAALTRALEAALWKVPDDPGKVCRGKPTRVEVIVFPPASSFALSGRTDEGVERAMAAEADRIRGFVLATAERRVGALGCPPMITKDAAPAAVARVTVAAWGWDVEAIATQTTTVRTRGREVRDVGGDQEGLARVRARASLHLDVYDGSRMQSGSAEGSSDWRVLTGKDAKDWPVDQLPLIYEPPSRVFTDSYDEDR